MSFLPRMSISKVSVRIERRRDAGMLGMTDGRLVFARHERFCCMAFGLIVNPVAMAQTTAITGGKVVIGDGSVPVEGGTVIIRNGKVVAAGAGVRVPAGAEIVDASGKWVTPGIFAGFQPCWSGRGERG